MSNTTNTAAPARLITGDDIAAHVTALTRDSVSWLQAHWLQILIAAGIAAVIVIGLMTLRRYAEKLCDRPQFLGGWGRIVGRAAARTHSFFIVMVAARLVSGYAVPPPAVATTIVFLFTVAAVFQAAIWARELILGFVEHRTAGSEHAALGSAFGLIRLLVTFALFAIAFIVVLDNLGVNVTGLVAGLGVGGIAIGLAAQGIFADLFAALAIIFDRPFRKGDKISYDQTSGVIEEIGLKSTRIRSFDGEKRIIANKNLLDKEIQNTSDKEHTRIKLVIGVAYETPPDKLRAMPDMLTGIVEVAGATVARASFESFGASSIDFFLWFDVPGDDWPAAHKARDAIMIGIVERFAAEGIVIPYPTQTTYTAAPDGHLVMPYAEVQPVHEVARQAGLGDAKLQDS
ncbi:Small-conductance mechanosensitive channel [Sphingomonas guangdongensis]|uniref:Small-conductance mechanosensitive channel n=1 Tax=Sphingomonas guangdongensis TaxID=1141890 RepID=A0A285Q9Z6_9SPHN|nr:mechanosensitive ion channel family protein [Sphingomonas guangdongensis]SOB78683.1 Small-conductance mechanosensitive channel [Sphingomonas guangdongensis]